MTPSEPLRFRPAVRALLLAADGSFPLVLFRFRDGTQIWGLPGGGIDPGETAEQALRRELGEEMGLYDMHLGPHVWTRVNVWDEHRRSLLAQRDPAQPYDGQRDQIFVVRCERFDPDPAIGWEQMNAENVYEIRWWTPSEVKASHAHFTPQGLADLVDALIDDGPPSTPFEVPA